MSPATRTMMRHHQAYLAQQHPEYSRLRRWWMARQEALRVTRQIRRTVRNAFRKGE